MKQRLTNYWRVFKTSFFLAFGAWFGASIYLQLPEWNITVSAGGLIAGVILLIVARFVQERASEVTKS
jgi:hypothetical protein